jgi:hypothetical protein
MRNRDYLLKKENSFYTPGLPVEDMRVPVSFTGKRTDFGPIDYEILAQRKDTRFKYGYKGVLQNLSNKNSYYANYRYKGKRIYTASFRTIEEAAWAFYVITSELPGYEENPALQLGESTGNDAFAARNLVYAVNRMSKAAYADFNAKLRECQT